MEKGAAINRKIVLITGGNRGLGYGIIESLLERKTQLRVILTARNDILGHKAYDTLCQTYPDEKDHFFYHQLDITKSDSISALLEWVKEKFGKIDYLINNAGVFFRGSDFCLEIFNKTFEVNVYGTMNLTNEILVKDMINKGGKIINVGGRMGSLGRLTNKKLVDDFNFENSWPDLIIEQRHLTQLLKSSNYKVKLIADDFPSPSANEKCLDIGFTHLGSVKKSHHNQIVQEFYSLNKDLLICLDKHILNLTNNIQ